jgi:Ferric reductase like transmembrane component
LLRAILIWAALAIALVTPIVFAAASPLLAWRQPIYIVAGFAGVAALGLLLVQPLVIGGSLPGLKGTTGRRVHRWTGALLVAAVAVHVGGLWLTSPPDVIDALLLVSPTPFAVWGVLAMWAMVAAACVATLRRKVRLRPRVWQALHVCLAAIGGVGTIGHVILIEGTMETSSKVILCALVSLATLKVVVGLKSLGTPRQTR